MPLVVLILLALSSAALAAVPAVPEEAEYVEGMVSIRFAPGVTAAQRDEVFRDLGARSVRHLDWIDWWAVEMSRRTTRDAMARWGDSPLVEWIEPNGVVRGDGEIPDDPEFGRQWHLRNVGQHTGTYGTGTPGADVDAVKAWCITKGDPDVLVAVLDTGVRLDHPDLAPSIFRNPGEIEGNGIDDDGNGYVDDVHGWNFEDVETTPGNADASDTHGHGTLCAGIIAGLDNGTGAVGVAPGVSILPVRVLTETETFPPSGSHLQVAMGIRYAVDTGADVLSCSFGGQFGSGLLKAALEYAELRSVEAVCAAGNSQQDIDFFTFFPAGYDLTNIISVAASDPDDDLAIAFSNYGFENVDLVAPGVDIWGPIHRRNDPNDLYGMASGTSFAAPMVAGAMALLESYVPGLDHPTPREVLLTGIDERPRLFGFVGTGGRLNVHRLLRSVSDLDEILPARVVDLEVAEVGRNWIELEWTASGDDGLAGTACCYDIRYAPFEIGNNFDLMPILVDPPAPLRGGERQRFRIDNLDPGTEYHFALTVSDEAYGITVPSNEVSGVTDAVAFTLDAADVSLSGRTGQLAEFSLSLQNRTPLDFDLQVSSDREWLLPIEPSGIVPGGATVSVAVQWNASRMWPGTHTGTVEIAADGGSQVTRVPVTLNVTPAAELDVAAASLDVGEAFPTSPALAPLTIRNVGYQPLTLIDVLTLGDGYSASPTEASVAPGGSLDLEVRLDPVALGVHPGTLTIITDDPFSGTVTLPLTGLGVEPPEMELALESVASTAFSGIPSEPVELPVRNSNPDGAHLRVRLSSVEFHDQPGDGDRAGRRRWLSIEPAELVIPPGETATALVRFGSEHLAPGDFRGRIAATANDPDRSRTMIPVDVEVLGVADLGVEDGAVDFGAIPAGTYRERSLSLSNPGTESLVVSPRVEGPFRVMSPALEIDPGEAAELRVRFRPDGSGLHASLMRLETNDPDRPLAVVPLLGRASETAVWNGEVRVEGDFVLAEGRSVTAGPGTKILVEPASGPGRGAAGFRVRGELRLSGTAEEPVVLEAVDGAAWDGLRVEGRAVVAHARISGARTALRAHSGSDVTVECARFSGNDHALHHEAGARTRVRGTRLESRASNLVLDGADGLEVGAADGRQNVFVEPVNPDGVHVKLLSAPSPPPDLSGNAWLVLPAVVLGPDDEDRLRSRIVGPGAEDVVLLPLLDRLPEDCEDLVEPPPPALPSQFSFARGLQNPTRGDARIDFELPAGFHGRVVLDVYDVRGARVRRILDQPGEPGRFDVSWRLDDGAGRPVATGVYFLRLGAGEFSGTRKLLVLR